MKMNVKILSAVTVMLFTPLSFALGGDPYIGGTLGHGWSKQDLESSVAGISDGSLRGDAIELAFIAGWGWNFDSNVYLGIEGEIAYSVDNSDNNDNLPDGDNDTLSAGFFGRAGMWFGQNIMFYGKLGVKANSVNFDINKNSIYTPSIEYGAGFDYILNTNWTLRTELTQESYMGDEDVYENYSVDKRQESLSMGFMYHF